MQQESDLDDSLMSSDYFDRADYDYQHTDLERYNQVTGDRWHIYVQSH